MKPLLLTIPFIIFSCSTKSKKETFKPKVEPIIAIVTKNGIRQAQLVTWVMQKDSSGKIDTQYFEKILSKPKPQLDSITFLPIKDSTGKIKTYQEELYNPLKKDSVNWRVEARNFDELIKPKQ